MIILCDVDGVVADMLPAWLACYNRDYGDLLRPDDVVAWDVSKFVKPECGKRIFAYLDLPTLYDDVMPVDGAKAGIQVLRDLGHRVVFVSACTGDEMCRAKVRWLNEHGFTEGMKNTVLTGTDHPSLKAIMRADLLIEDYEKNLHEYGGNGLLLDAPYNRHDDTFPRVHSWSQIVNWIHENTKVAA